MFSLKKIVILLFLVLITSCYSNSNFGRNLDLPEWYVSPPKNNANYLYGVGEGYDSDNASKVALNNLSSKLMVTISSKSELIRKESTYDYVEESNQKIKEEVPNLTFNNYEIQQNEYKNGVVYVVVAVDKPQFVSDNIKELNKINDRIDNLDLSSKNNHIFLRRQSLIQINELAVEAEKITRILGSLTNSIDTNKNIKKYSEYRKELDVVNSNMIFYIKTEKTPAEILEVIKNEINAEGIKIVNSPLNVNVKKLAILEVRTSTITKEIYGAINAKLNIYLSLKDSRGRLLGSNQLEASGSSVISEKQAIKSSSIDLKNQIKEGGIMELLQNK